MKPTHKKTREQNGCLWLLVALSGYGAITSFPHPTWKIGATFGTLAFVCLFLRVGWFVPFTIAGFYFGLMCDPAVKGGSYESQMRETLMYILAGTLGGFAVGALIDKSISVADSHPADRNESEDFEA